MPIKKSIQELNGEKFCIPATYWIITRAENKKRTVKNDKIVASQVFYFSGYKDQSSCEKGHSPLSKEQISIRINDMPEEDEKGNPVKLEKYAYQEIVKKRQSLDSGTKE